VVYNRGSGGTHLLDAFSAAALRRIAAGPLSFGALARDLAERSGAGEDKVRARLGEVLDSLHQLGLAEPVASCGSAS